MNSMQRSLRWSTEQGNGLEFCALRCTPQGLIAEGVTIGPAIASLAGSAPFGCSYAVHCDQRWHVRQVEVKVAGGAHLLLHADGEGFWRGADGAPLPALDGCIDVDLTCTPFTNTLPIRRLGEALRERQEIRVAHIVLPDEGVIRSRQAYTALGGGRYRFESLSDRFQADIETDADGLVVRYPGLFRRLEQTR